MTSRHRISLTLFALALMSALVAPLVASAAEVGAPLVVIDPGHGGRYSNANANGLREKNVNLAIAQALRSELETRGYAVVMTRETDRAVNLADIPTWNYSSRRDLWSYRRDYHRGSYGGIPSDDLQARCNVANRLGADLFISIHSNGARRKSARGYETYATGRDPQGVRLSRLVHSAVLARTGAVNRGVHQNGFYVVRWTDMPAILIESGFISNRAEASLLASATYQSAIASGVADGVDRWAATRPTAPRWPRVSATSSVKLAAALARAATVTTNSAVVVAPAGEETASAAAAALAARLGAPLLWLGAKSTAPEVEAEIKRLGPTAVLAVGSATSNIDARVRPLVSRATGGRATVGALVGERPAITAARAAEYSAVPTATSVLIAAAEDPAATVVAASAAAWRHAPLLLTEGGKLPADAATWLAGSKSRIKRVYLVGDAIRVPRSSALGRPFTRVTVTDRFAAHAALTSTALLHSRSGSGKPVVVNLRETGVFLSAAAATGTTHQPLAPVLGSYLPPATRVWITNRRAQIGGFTVVETGGSIPLRMDWVLQKADR